ncbi:hypothetical protein [Aquisalimonas asiatica]|uniref:Glycosyltransferase involved in cell wall bisynthesis n=1 Tax=Aquisalimonas asiatica TaxID=406100 RepID=A0A1H8U601_9GAMM|nr:hypothetical protein [Aquisalimonas asiatica]SEO98088.1 Glycosyltransferase involved in cell wall bisynthesis [Aquisalimonas asiatica]
MSTFHFIGGDRKARELVRAIRQRGGQAAELKLYPFTAWFHFMRPGGASGGDVAVIRYLNDHPSLVVSLLKPVGDILTVTVFKLRRVRVFWLCHNLDRETEKYWPLVSRFRRRIWERVSERILVTDPLLMDAANTVFYRVRHKVAPITLGLLPKDKRFNRKEAEREAREFLRSGGVTEDGRRRTLNILCAGVSGKKYLHFDLLPQLERGLREAGWEPRILVVTRFQKGGVWSRGKDYSGFIEWCDRAESVLLLRDYIDIDEQEWADDIDLVWRSMSDWSFAFTLLNASAAGIPILSYQSGAMGLIVEKAGLGASISWDFCDLDEKVKAALAVPETNFQVFLEKRSWDNAARVLMSFS